LNEKRERGIREEEEKKAINLVEPSKRVISETVSFP